MSRADGSRDAVEEELREVVRERVEAVHAKNPAPLAASQARDIVTFDVLPPLHARGSDAVEAKTQAWFGAYAGDIGYEVQDLQVTANDYAPGRRHILCTNDNVSPKEGNVKNFIKRSTRVLRGYHYLVARRVLLVSAWLISP